MIKFKAFFVFGLLLFFGFNGFAFAAGSQLSSCTMTATNPVSVDGSDCGPGLACDQSVMVCVAPTETACMAGANGAGCSIGQKCVTASGSTTFQTAGSPGVCATISGGSTENNALGDVVCNVYKLVTGKVGRGIVVIVLFVTGVTFYLGKVNWGTIVAIVLGAGLCFGGPAVVSVLVGKNFLC